MSRRRALLAALLWSIVLVATRCPWMTAPFSNAEFAFSEAAHALAFPDEAARLDRYWNNQANPLGYPLITAALLKATGIKDSFALVRVPSLVAAVMLLGVTALVWRRLGGGDGTGLHLALACLALHPMLWVFSGRCTSDVMTAALLALAFALCALGLARRWGWHVLAGGIFALAMLCKPNAALLGMGFVYLVAFHQQASEGVRASIKHRVGVLLCYTLLPAALLAAYFAWVHSAFDIFLMPARYRQKHAPLRFTEAPAILVQYLAFLAMFLGAVALLPLARLLSAGRRQSLLILALGAVLGGLFYLGPLRQSIGELNLGIGNALLPGTLVRLCETVAALLAIAWLIDVMRHSRHGRWRDAARFTLAIVIPFLLVSALARPAQRYLLMVLPYVLILILLSAAHWRRLRAAAVLASVVVFLALDVLVAEYLASQGRAANALARRVVAADLADQTDPGPYGIQAGQYFPAHIDEQAARYRILAVPADDDTIDRQRIVMEEPHHVFGHPFRRYLLVRSAAAPTRRP